jgi:hypothetical protein
MDRDIAEHSHVVIKRVLWSCLLEAGADTVDVTLRHWWDGIWLTLFGSSLHSLP